MGTTNDHDTVADLIPAYVLNSLDAEEAEQVIEHLKQCLTCQEALAAYEAVADALPLAVKEVTPSAALKEQLFERIRESSVQEATSSASESGSPLSAGVAQPSSSRLADFRLSVRRFFSGPVWRPLALAAVILLLLLNGFLWWQQSQSKIQKFDQFILTGTEQAPSAEGLIIVSEDGLHGTLIVDGLPDLDKEVEQYQLWLIKDGQRANGGVFSVYGSGYQSFKVDSPDPLGSYTSFGVTIEPAGGSAGPTGERVLGFNLN